MRKHEETKKLTSKKKEMILKVSRKLKKRKIGIFLQGNNWTHTQSAHTLHVSDTHDTNTSQY